MVMVAGAKELSKELNGAGYDLSWKPTVADGCCKVEIVEVQWRTSLTRTCFLGHKFGSWQCRLHPLPEQSFFFGCVMLDYHSLRKWGIVSFFPRSLGMTRWAARLFLSSFSRHGHLVEGSESHGGLSSESWKYIVIKSSFSTTLDILPCCSWCTFSPAKTGVATARRWSP